MNDGATVVFDTSLKIFGDTVSYVLNTEKSKFRWEVDGEWIRVFNKRAIDGKGRASVHVSRCAIYEPEWAPGAALSDAEVQASLDAAAAGLKKRGRPAKGATEAA